MDNTNKLSPENVLPFLLGGRALLTVHNEKTGTHNTYRVTAPGKTAEAREKASVLFVSVLTGPENTTNYTYAGIILRDSGVFRSTAKSKLAESTPSVAGFKWVLGRAKNDTLRDFPHVSVLHHGRCGTCGRVLTVPESITSGLGPICAGRMNR